MRITRTGRVLAVVATFAFVLAACGGDDGGDDGAGDSSSPATETVSAASFVDLVCTELQTWTTSLQEKGQAMNEAIGQAQDPSETKDLLVGYLDDAVSSTQEAAAAIGEAGAPDVENGEQISQAIIGVLGQVEKVFEAARQKAADLPQDPAGLSAGATQIGAEIQSAFSENPLGDLQENEELSAAAAESESCQAMNSMTAP